MEEIKLAQNIISSNNLVDEVFGNFLVNENYKGINKDVEKILWWYSS